jgi:hypothetical protein
MKNVICDVCNEKVESIQSIVIPVKVKVFESGNEIIEDRIDICKSCLYDLNLEIEKKKITIIKSLKRKKVK